MRKLGLLTMCGALLFVRPTQANAQFWTGNAIYENCTAQKSDSAYFQKNAVCIGYTSGVFDLLRIMGVNGLKFPVICPSGEVTVGQATDIFRKYLIDHPETRDRPAGSLAAVALISAFKCPEK